MRLRNDRWGTQRGGHLVIRRVCIATMLLLVLAGLVNPGTAVAADGDDSGSTLAFTVNGLVQGIDVNGIHEFG